MQQIPTKLFYFIQLIVMLTFLGCNASKTVEASKESGKGPNLIKNCPLPIPKEMVSVPELILMEEYNPADFIEPPAPAPPRPRSKKSKSLPESTPTVVEEAILPAQPWLEEARENWKNLGIIPTKKFGADYLYQETDGLWGLKTSDGVDLIKPIFKEIFVFPNRSYFLGKKTDENGFNLYNRNGEPSFKTNYDFINLLTREGYAIIKKDKKHGIATEAGEILVAPKYKSIFPSWKSWIVRKEVKTGVLDLSGKEMIPPTYRTIKAARTNDKSDFLFAKEDNGQLTIIKDGKVAYRLGIDFKDNSVNRVFDERYMLYNKFLIDLKKQTYVVCEGEKAIRSSQNVRNLFWINKEDRTWAFNEKGNLISEFPFLSKLNFVKFLNGVTVMAINTGGDTYAPRYGLLDDELNWALKPQFLAMEQVKDTNFYVVKNLEKKVGLIDQFGKVIIPFDYDRMVALKNKVAAFSNKKSVVAEILDLSGKKEKEVELDYLTIGQNEVGYELMRKSDKKRVLLNNEFEEIEARDHWKVKPFGKDGIKVNLGIGMKTDFRIIDFKGQPYSINIDGKRRTDFKILYEAQLSPFYLIELDGQKYLYNTDTKKANLINAEITSISGMSYRKDKSNFLISYSQTTQLKGMIDTLGNEILPPVFRSVSIFNGELVVKKETESYRIKRNGEYRLE